MKRILIFATGVLWASINSHAAQTAQARIYCLSLRFQQGTDQIGSTLGLTTIGPSINGELAPTFDAPTHFSEFVLDSIFFDEPIPGDIEFDVPPFADANQNGFWDFFETSQQASGTTMGSYWITGVDRGNVTAKWSRPAGFKDGTCILTLTSTMGFARMDFTHSFELIEYAGPLTYTPGASNVRGAVNLTQTGAADNVLAGPIELTKSPTKRFNELNLKHSVWTNASSQTFNISNDVNAFERDTFLKTNYFGFVDFDDGDPNTFDADYPFWFLSIDDVNDSDNDAIPDFSDDPGSGTVRRPTVLLSLGDTDLSFSISSTIGRTVEIQEITSLSQTNWATVRSVSPINDPQVVTLPRPTEGTKFWRVRVP
jgi:hypothetical protein